MRFNFFTMGGSQFWEDVFYYQKWRIQRNFETKKCRLLDPWDIRRHSGSFESCKKAFFKIIEVYELSRQKGHLIIMLHGLFDSKNIFKPMWRAALKEGYLAAALNFPSTQKHLESHVRQLDFFLNNLEDIQEVSFITKGIGGLIVRSLLNIKDSKWKSKIKIGRIVQISPPNKGSKLFGKLSQYKVANMIFGPVLNDCRPNKVAYIPEFPDEIEFGIIESDSLIQKLIKLLPYNYKNSIYAENEVYSDKAKATEYVDNWHWSPTANKIVIEKSLNFLKFGSFRGKKSEKIKKV